MSSPAAVSKVSARNLYRHALLFLFYFAAGKIGLLMPFTSGNVSPVWLPSGIAIAAIVLWGYSLWPAVALGAFLVNFLSPVPPVAALAIAVGNTSSALAGAWLLRNVGRLRVPLARLRDVLALVVLGAIASPTVAASVGVTVLFLTGVDPWSEFRAAWLIWWLGDAMGVLIVAPLLLCWQRTASNFRGRELEFVALVAGVIASSLVVFDNRVGVRVAEELLAFAVFPFVIWAALRFGAWGSAVATAVIAAIAVAETASGFGPFAQRAPVYNAVLLQGFMAVVCITGLALATVIMERTVAEDALEREQRLLQERQRAELALRRSEERLKLAQLAANIGTWEWNMHSGEVLWSPEVAALHGLTPQQFDGRYESWLNTVHPEDRDLVVREVARAVGDTGDYEVEYRTLRHDGSTYWTYARGKVLKDEAGQPTRLLGLCMDVSRRKAQAQALVESESKFRAVAETAAAAIYIHDGQRLLYVNQMGERITGYTRDELLAMDMWALVHPDFRDTVRQRSTARFRGQPSPPRYEYKIITRSGEERWLDFSASMVEFGGRRCILATALDVTERKRTEQALRGSEQRLAGIIGSAMDAIITVDRAQNVLAFNAAAEKVFAYDAAEIIGQPLNLLIPERFRDAHTRHIQHFGLTGTTSRTMYSPSALYGRRKDGEEFPIEATISQIESGGQRLFTVILRDITSRRQAEEALIRSEKLASAGRLAATMAHEINNPLEAVTNLLFLANQAGSMDDAVRNYLQQADSEVRRVSHIARQTLAFYRESSVPAPIRPTMVLDDVLDLLARKIGEKSIQVDKQYRDQSEILGIAGELRQVFSNLLANSLDSLSPGGRIILRVALRRCWRSGEPKVVVTIADNGAGISPAHAERIFEPFFTTKKETGTGLGLWIAKQIVDKHGGSIRVRSRATRLPTWTVFSVFLPATASDMQSQAVA